MAENHKADQYRWKCFSLFNGTNTAIWLNSFARFVTRDSALRRRNRLSDFYQVHLDDISGPCSIPGPVNSCAGKLTELFLSAGAFDFVQYRSTFKNLLHLDFGSAVLRSFAFWIEIGRIETRSYIFQSERIEKHCPISESVSLYCRKSKSTIDSSAICDENHCLAFKAIVRCGWRELGIKRASFTAANKGYFAIEDGILPIPNRERTVKLFSEVALGAPKAVLNA